MTGTALQSARTNRVPLPVLIAAWAVPVLVLGGFALVSGFAVAVVLVGSLRARSRALRWWAGALVAAYAIPLTLWLTGPSSAPSLTKYMSSTVTAAVVAVGVAVAIAHHVVALRPRRR